MASGVSIMLIEPWAWTVREPHVWKPNGLFANSNFGRSGEALAHLQGIPPQFLQGSPFRSDFSQIRRVVRVAHLRFRLQNDYATWHFSHNVAVADWCSLNIQDHLKFHDVSKAKINKTYVDRWFIPPIYSKIMWNYSTIGDQGCLQHRHSHRSMPASQSGGFSSTNAPPMPPKTTN